MPIAQTLLDFYSRLRRHSGRWLRRADDLLESILPQPSASTTTTGPRKIIVHYHAFKTAGTSIDFILESHFGRRWIEWEAEAAPEALAEFVSSRRKLVALSSHIALTRLPSLPGTTFFPIVFLRHPIDRIPSVYRFYRKHSRHQEPAAEMARRSSLAEYIEWQLGFNRLLSNFYTARLAYWKTTPEYQEQPQLDRALITLAELPFVGLTERFDQSVERLNAYLQPHFPGFQARPVRLNITRQGDASLDQRLADFRAAIGDPLYQRLLQENQDDLVLYNAVLADFAANRPG